MTSLCGGVHTVSTNRKEGNVHPFKWRVKLNSHNYSTAHQPSMQGQTEYTSTKKGKLVLPCH
ncbi:hypothetical protein RHMOL_Rhmol01G0271600 [Rhododendron molle]|uniref:Uncharacterized protein n=1 Tax=Rhododendron molle TaxID=49168 RepID=A0ACC0Q5P6_RHOML|nr:hypothetical protein RHMOL_Rhmol01G0271600 [Rhododendron molle]